MDELLDTLAATTSFPRSVPENARGLIEAIGYPLTDADAWAFGFAVAATEQEIKNACNVPTVPEGLYFVAARLIAAAFLSLKHAGGTLDAEGLRFEPVLKQIKEGDTDVTFDTEHTMNAEQRLEAFLALCWTGREQFIRYRRLVW